MPEPRTVRARQRGWAGVLTLLLAVLFVALAAGILLRHGAPAAPAAGAAPDPRAAGAKGPGGVARIDAEGVVPAPGNAVERARALEESVRQQATEREKRIEDATK